MELVENSGCEGTRLGRSSPIGETLGQRDTATRASLADVDETAHSVAAGEEDGKPLSR